MPYVQRDENGKVTGLFRHFNEGVSEEFLEDDDPEVVDSGLLNDEVKHGD